MNVLLINGSPHENGCTFTALSEISRTLGEEGITSEIVHIGTKPVRGCIGCGKCSGGRCVFDDDIANRIIERAENADGFIFGSPVHYASPSGAMVSLMDRIFYAGGGAFRYKPGAAVVSARRGGTTAAYEVLMKYIGISRMIAVPSQYWNMVHGSCPQDVMRDEEGLQTMRTLAHNMAWLLRLIESGRHSGILPPEPEKIIRTNFIR
ncbi:MAG: flavodoxin family protein [Eubacteriales bacterium]